MERASGRPSGKNFSAPSASPNMTSPTMLKQIRALGIDLLGLFRLL
jgi:hypothetical protein